MAGDDFQKGGDKKSEGLGLRTGIKKAKKEREDRISEAINLGAKEFIADFKLVESVLEEVEKGMSYATIVILDAKYYRHKVYERSGAVPNDKIEWSAIFDEIESLMENEGVEMDIDWSRGNTESGKQFVNAIHLYWD